MIGATLGASVQLYSNAVRKLPLLRSAYFEALELRTGVDSLCARDKTVVCTTLLTPARL